MSIRFILSDDHRMVLDGLQSLFEKHPDLDVVATATDGREVVEQCLHYRPDVVVMDIEMPNLNGMEATRRILETQPEIKIIALSMRMDSRSMQEMFEAGASAYLHKSCDIKELILAIRTVYRGKTYLSPEVAGTLVHEHLLQRQKGHPDSAFQALSGREREVLQLLAEGRCTKEIALALNLSRPTIETHRRRIMNKLNLRSVAELTKYAVREGISSLDS